MNNKLANPFDMPEIDSKAITTRPDLEPMDWSQFAREANLKGTPATAEDMVGRTFDILNARAFDSAFEGQDHAWFCVVRPVGQDENYELTLGGQVVGKVLDAYAATGSNRPLRVTLGMVKGGKFGKYYTFE